MQNFDELIIFEEFAECILHLQNFDVLDGNSSALLLASAPASAEALITAMESRPASDNASFSVSKMGHKSLLSDELPKCPPVPPDLGKIFFFLTRYDAK